MNRGRRALGLGFLEVGGRSVDGALEAGLVAAEGVQDAPGSREGGEGAHSASGVVGAGVALIANRDLAVDDGGFERDAAIEAPLRGGDLMYEVALGEAGGLEELKVLGEQVVEELVAFVREDGDAAGQAVGAAVAG